MWLRIEIDMLNYLLVIHLVSILLVFWIEKVIDLGKAFDMIHETDGKGHWFGKGIWYDSWNIPPLYTEILHTSDATKLFPLAQVRSLFSYNLNQKSLGMCFGSKYTTCRNTIYMALVLANWYFWGH